MRRGVLIPTAVVAVISGVPWVALNAADPGADAAWEAIGEYRRNLSSQSPLHARFVQTYTPEGFSSGESEGGRFALSLPECLRWDYDEPFEKSFILCGDVFHYWNPGEPEGHRQEVDALEQPGLDLLLLDVDELRERYRAQAPVERDGAVEIVLEPFERNDIAVEATLRLDTGLERLMELRYVDELGDRTSFTISNYESGVVHGAFNPPADVVWIEDR